jgi:hypothetical protein
MKVSFAYENNAKEQIQPLPALSIIKEKVLITH